MIRSRCDLVRMVLPAALLVLGSPLAAQVPVEWTQYQSPGGQSSFGDGLGTADMNADGFDDLIVAQPKWSIGAEQSAGKLWVLYGPLPVGESVGFVSSDPTEGEHLGEEDLFGLGSSCLSAGDVDEDGHADLLVGAAGYSTYEPVVGGIGRAHLFFGPDFTRETIFDDPTPEAGGRFGKAVVLADMTDDGKLDVVIGAPEATGLDPFGNEMKDVGEIWIWRSDDGFQYPIHLASPHATAYDDFGWSLDWVALYGPEPDTLMVGAPGHYTCCPGSFGAIYAFRTPDLSDVRTIPCPPFPEGTAVNFGDVVFCGDVTGDGVKDLVVAAMSSYITCGGQGAVVVLAGPQFDTVPHVLTSPNACHSFLSGIFGWSTGVGDIDGDGSMDIVVGDSGQDATLQHVYAYYGPEFDQVQALDEELSSGLAGDLTIGDYDGDGRVECAVADFGVYVGDARTLLADADALSTSAGTTVTFTLDATSTLAGGAYLAALSTSGSAPGLVPAPGVYLPLNFDAVTAVGLSLVNGPILPGFAGVLDTAGQASFQLVLPPGSAGGLAGLTLSVAAVSTDPSGHLVAGSSAVELVIGP